MLFTIGDLHLPLGIDKPMDIFGGKWDNYVSKLYDNWQSMVGDGDTVVIPGDLSWATYIEDAERDFEFLESLNGKKIILKGNHDYWWTTMAKMEKFILEHGYSSISFLQNNSFEVEGISVCGTRGWLYPGFSAFTKEDERYFNREVARLEMSLKSAVSDERYVFMHYPPTSRTGNSNAFIEIMKEYGVKKCFYGHLHGSSHIFKIPYNVDGIKFSLVASDYLSFKPLEIRRD